MATYKAQFDAAQTDDLQQKVEMAIVKKAAAEAAIGTASAARALASGVLNSPAAYKERFTIAVVSNLNLANPADTAIDTAVVALWPFFALGLTAL